MSTDTIKKVAMQLLATNDDLMFGICEEMKKTDPERWQELMQMTAGIIDYPEQDSEAIVEYVYPMFNQIGDENMVEIMIDWAADHKEQFDHIFWKWFNKEDE